MVDGETWKGYDDGKVNGIQPTRETLKRRAGIRMAVERVQLQAQTPLGASASLTIRAAGGDQRAQDTALFLGLVVDTAAQAIPAGRVRGLWVAPKFVPNPYGKLGGPEHVAAVDLLKADITGRGLIAGGEFRVLTPKGDKAYRFIDVVGINPKSGLPVEFYQVGKQTQSGQPIARETRAINDIRAADPTINPVFIPYN